MVAGDRENVLIVVPAYNEEAALPLTLAALTAAVPGAHVLVVNDGSLDRTGKMARACAATQPGRVFCVDLPVNCGIGGAVQTGLLYAWRSGYRWVVQYDGDGQHEAQCIPDMLDVAATHDLDLCIGSRFLGQADNPFHSTAARRAGIRFFAGLIGLLTGKPVTDPTSGFRVYGHRAIRFFARCYPDDYPEPEALFWCVRNQMRVQEVAVRMHARVGGTSSIRTWRTVYYMLKVTLAILVDRLRPLEDLR